MDSIFIKEMKHESQRPRDKIESYNKAIRFAESDQLSMVLRGASLVVASYKSVELSDRCLAMRAFGLVKDLICELEDPAVKPVSEAGLRGDPDQVLLSLLTAAWHVGIYLEEPVDLFFSKIELFSLTRKPRLSLCVNAIRSLCLYAYSSCSRGDFDSVRKISIAAGRFYSLAVCNLNLEKALSPAQARDMVNSVSALQKLLVGAALCSESEIHVASNDVSLWTVDSVQAECTRIKVGVSRDFDQRKIDFLAG